MQQKEKSQFPSDSYFLLELIFDSVKRRTAPIFLLSGGIFRSALRIISEVFCKCQKVERELNEELRTRTELLVKALLDLIIRAGCGATY
jgi:hypothetical protein